jgi:hypothetical protein
MHYRDRSQTRHFHEPLSLFKMYGRQRRKYLESVSRGPYLGRRFASLVREAISLADRLKS